MGFSGLQNKIYGLILRARNDVGAQLYTKKKFFSVDVSAFEDFEW